MCIFKENEPGPKSRNENGIDAHGFTNAMRISANTKNNTSPLHGKGYELRPTCNCPFSDICPKKKLKQISFHEKCCANTVMTLYKIKRFTTGASVTESGHCWIDNNSRRNNSASNISKNKFTPMRQVNYKRTTPTPVIFLFECETP